MALINYVNGGNLPDHVLIRNIVDQPIWGSRLLVGGASLSVSESDLPGEKGLHYHAIIYACFL